MRRRLARVLRSEGAILVSATALLTGEIVPGTGRLAAATGATTGGDCDAGLEPLVAPIYQQAITSGLTLQEGQAHLGGSAWEWDVYRRQRRLPRQPHERLLLLARTLLSVEMNLVYSLQTGRMQLSAVK